jgi:hypothetical protein
MLESLTGSSDDEMLCETEAERASRCAVVTAHRDSRSTWDDQLDHACF